MHRTAFWGIVTLFIPTMIWGQTETNVEALRAFANQKRLEWEQQRQEAEAFARANGIPIRREFPDGTIIEIQKLINGILYVYITENANAAVTTQTHRLWPGGSLGLSLTGSGYNQLGEWDGGAVRSTHQEFGSRVTQVDGATSLSSHATHVAGTMIAAGVDASAKGMAYQANLRAFDWNNDQSEMASEAAAGMEISNHSYGYITGWYFDGLNYHWYGDVTIDQNESYYFGFYDATARDWDQIAYDAPYYLMVKSAGNDRDDTAPAAGTTHTHNGSGSYTDTHYDDGWDNGGFDVLRSASVSKNVLTVAAVGDIKAYADETSVQMSSFSSWGPTDDGRIKPDISANGIDLYSPVAGSNTAYDVYSGTSMAAPNVSGSLALLQQHYKNTHGGNAMRAATLKALVIHTADEAGDYPGPDYSFGWGLLNTRRAALVISEDVYQNVIDERVLNDGGSYTRTVNATGNEPLKVTLVWTDPPGTPPAAALDPPDTMLVNDLDLRVVRNTTTYYPWKLDRNNPAAAATNNSENDIDNVEQVYIENPVAGSYTIIVDHDGSLTNGSQAFSIVISGIDEFTNPPQNCSPTLLSPSDGATDVALSTVIQWEEVPDASSYDLYFGTDGGGTSTPTNIVNGQNQTSNTYTPDLQPNTTYYIQVIPRNSQGTNTGCATIWSFTTESAAEVTTFPYTENFDTLTTIGGGNDWKNDSDDDGDWALNSGATPSSNTGPDQDHTSGTGQYVYVEASSGYVGYPQRTAFLLTPYFDFSTQNNPTLEFWYHMYGATMGNLYLDVYANGEWNTSIYQLEGQQSAGGTDWKVATVNLSDYKSGNIQRFRFRGVTGDNFQSDIAIDDFTIRGEAFHTFLAGSTEKYTFPNTMAAVQFTVANSGDVTLEVIKYDSDPGVVGTLPTGVMNISRERYWKITAISGTADGTYSLSLDLAGMSGINNYSTLYLLRRADSNSPWNTVGTNNYSGSGTIVEWIGITGGFSEFAVGGGADNPLPVQLTLFQAFSREEGILLTWRTESELMNQGFILYRKTATDTTWETIADYLRHPALKGQGTTARATDYRFLDANVQKDQTYQYRLADVDYTGKITLLKTITITHSQNPVPEKFVLKSAYPNPFNPEIHITFGLPEQRKVRVDIFDITGRRVRTLFQGTRKAGWHTLTWNSTTDQGIPASSGTYILRIQAEEDGISRKIILLR